MQDETIYFLIQVLAFILTILALASLKVLKDTNEKTISFLFFATIAGFLIYGLATQDPNFAIYVRK
jgi:hypothetical protein